jgi:hypothetical protein
MGKKINKNKYQKNKENNEEVMECENFNQIDELSIIINKVIQLNPAKFEQLRRT